MEPLLHERDRIVAVLFEGRVNPPSLGDVVVLHHRLPDGGTEMVVKRIVGVGGDRLRTVQGQLIRNGRVMPEPYVPEPMIDWWPPPQVLVGLLPPQLPMEGDAYVVPDGQVIVMGDNRNYSEDSRDWGPIAESELVGRVVAIYWPRDRIGRAR
jgi:signal peptidase I